MRTRSCFVAALLSAVFFALSFARSDDSAADDGLRERNVHFLDRAKGEPDKLILELTEEAQSSEGAAPDSRTLEKLGWLNILYRNDSKAALGWFEKAIASDKKNIGALEGALLCRMALGDNDPLAQNTCEIIEADPNSRFATLYLRVLHGSLYITDSWTAWPPSKRKAFFDRLLASGLQNPENEALIKHYLVSILLGQQKRAEAFKLWQSTGIVDKWLVCGFFSPEGPCGFEDLLPPELDTRRVDLAKKFQVDNDQIGWVPVTIDKEASYSPVIRAAKNTGSCLFAATYIKTTSNCPAAIRVSTALSYKLWLNGALLRISDKTSEFLPIREHVGTTLQEGNNLLMLELCGPLPTGQSPSFDFMLRVTDPEGRPLDNVSFSNEFESGKPPEVRASGKELDPVALRPTAKQAYAEAVGGADRTFMDYLGYVFFLSEDDETELSFQYDSEVFAAHTDCAIANLLMAHAYRSNEFLPAQQSQNKYRSGLERAVELDTVMTPALYHLGNIYKEKDPDKAIDYFRRALVVQPAHVDSVMALEQIFVDRGWLAERLDLLRRLLELRPDCRQALTAMFDHYFENLSLDKAREVGEKLDRLGESPVAWYAAKVAARRGDYEVIIAEYRRQIAESPQDPQSYLRLASTLADLARYPEARELLEKVIALDPATYFFLHREIGDLWAREGAFDKAGGQWRKVLDIPICDRRLGFGKHYDVRTERFLATREGGNLELALQEKFKVNAAEIVKGAPGQDRYPKASSITLFLQYVVRFTGEDLKHAEHTSHHFIKIMNKKGGERYGRISTGQVLDECRVYTPDGQILEADGVQERGNLAMPELDAGTILEMKRSFSTNVPFDLNGCVRQLFKSPWLKFEDEPILRARVAIIIPSATKRLLPSKEALEVATGLPPKFFLRSSHMPVEARVEEGEGYVSYVYDLNDLEDIVAEPFMPPADEVLPYISVFQWPFDIERMLHMRRSDFVDRRVNRNVRDKALELTQSMPDLIAKLKRIYQFVVTEIKDGAQSNPSQTLIEKQGPGLDLFIAMVRGIGLEADHALVIPPVSGPRTQKEWELDGPPFAAELAAVRLPSDNVAQASRLCPAENLPPGCWVGKDWLFVSVSQFSLFRAIPPALEGGKAVVFHRGGATIVDLPARSPLDLKGIPVVTVEILGDGKATVKGELPMPSFQSAQMRVFVEQNMGEEQRRKMFQRLAARLFPGINISSSEMVAFDPFDIGLRFKLEGTTNKFTTPTESGWLFRPALPALELSKVFTGQKKRVFPLRISQALAAFCLQEKLRVIAPDGYEIVPPGDSVLLTPFGSYSMRFVKSTAQAIPDPGPGKPEDGAGEEPAASDENAGGGTEPTSTRSQPPQPSQQTESGRNMVEVERSLLLYNQDIEPDDFEKFMAFLKAIDQIERRQVEVRRR